MPAGFSFCGVAYSSENDLFGFDDLLFNKSKQDFRMSLYKYMSGTGAIRLFRSGMLRFTQPIEFNDPFEMQPFLKGLADNQTLENRFHDGFAKDLDPQIDEMLAKLNLTAEQKAKVNRDAIQREVESQAPHALDIFNTFARMITPLISRLLMWAHYADHHRGAVIEFDENHEFFNRRMRPEDDFRHF